MITDNGELVSNVISDWCSSHGIDHQRTAPHTSLQNGRAERLHRTIMCRARTMRLACDAPPNMWDEFCATAAYLTNLTATSSLNGKTPFEFWHGRRPSLSHLQEIGCRAFALIHDQPKVFRRSLPCTLIGYAPHSKAYRLWDRSANKIFNSFHVSFIEHLDSTSFPLSPGELINPFSLNDPPTWDSVADPTSSSSSSSSSSSAPSSSSSSSSIPLSSFPPLTGDSAMYSVDPPPAPALTPPVVPLPLPPAPPPVVPFEPAQPPAPRRSSRIPILAARSHSLDAHLDERLTATLDGRLDRRLAAALSDVADSASRCKAECAAKHSAHNNDHAFALLAEFSPLRDTHDIYPLDLLTENLSVPEVLSALADGSLDPVPDSDDDPSWASALASPEREYWIAGARDELQSLRDLDVFVLVPRSSVPAGQRPLKGKLVCKRKRDDAGNIVRYKVRYVAKGYAQQYGVDYDKTTAPTARLKSFRAILHVAASLGWDLQQFDIKTAFLHGILPEEETMFMEQPPGFATPGKEDWVMRLMKSIYGMKQASRIWNQTFHKTVQSWGFERLPCEWCVYRRRSATGTIIFAVHVDDIISAASSAAENERFRDFLSSKWDISALGPANFALGIAISRDLSKRTISLSQTALIDRVLEKFGMMDANPVETPMVPGIQLRRPDKSIPLSQTEAEWFARTPYRSLVGSLMYLAVGTRPDIAYAVGRLSTFLDCYRPEHWDAATRVLKYLKGTRALSLVLGGQEPVTLTGFSDSDYANCPDSSRSTSGYCFSLGSGVVSWSSRKQRTVADSSCYAKYIALHDASHEATFLRQLLDGLDLLPASPSRLFCDNHAATILTEDHVWHSRVKHIRVKYHHVRELVTDGELTIARVPSAENTADILTKPLNKADLLRLRVRLGLRPLSDESGRA
jgi:Reverse transcriptase (RNA-dependent DNA polymerase)